MASKWGDEAADNRMKMRKAQALMVPVYLFALLVLFLSHGTSVWTLLGVFLVGAVVVTAVIGVYERRMYRAATETLGVSVSRRKGKHPPEKSPAYEQWCEVNGLAPYSASTHIGP